MIPASYFFKDMYKQAFEEADEAQAIMHLVRFFRGLMTPIGGTINAVFGRRERNPVLHYGVHAYD